MFLQLRGWASTDATPAGAPRRPESRPGRAGRHRPTGWTSCCDAPIPAGQEARHARAVARRTWPSSASTCPSTTTVDPAVCSPQARRSATAARATVDGRQPVRHRCRWRGGTAPPTARPPTWCGAAGSASPRAAPVWCGARRPRCVRDGRANPNQLVIDETTVDELAAAALAPGSRPGRRAAADPLRALLPPRRRGPAPRTAYRHPLLDDRVGADDASVLTDDELDDLVDDVRRGRRAGRAGGLRLRRREALPRLPRPRAAHRLRPPRPLRRRPRRAHDVSPVGRRRHPCRGARPWRSPCGCRCSTWCRSPPGPTGSATRRRPARTGHAFGGDGTGLRHRPDRDRTQLLDMLTGLGDRSGLHHRRQPVLQPARPAAGLLPAVGRLHRRPRIRWSASPASSPPRPSSPNGIARSDRRRHRLLVPAGVAAQRGAGGAWPRGGADWSASAGWSCRTRSCPPTCWPVAR